ncbi:MAG: heterodisulfide reductase-related iron-sulfur binding cluster [Nanoarchaeota archaeon]
MVNDETVPLTEDEDIEVVKFKAESLKAEVGKFMFSGYCDQVSAMYHLDKDISKSHEAVLYMIKHFSKTRRYEREYIRSIFYHDLSHAYNRVAPVRIDDDFVITQAREQAFKRAIEMDEFKGMRTAIRFMEDLQYLNPYGKRREERFNWLDAEDNPNADFLYIIGSADLYFNHQRVQLMMYLLEKLRISYTISREEEDSGYLARVLGRPSTAEKLREMNKEMILKSNLKNIITSDPHCYEELKRDFEHSDITIWYMTELVGNKIFSLNSRQLHKKRMKAVFQSTTILPAKIDKMAQRIMRNIGCEIIETSFMRDHVLSTGEGGGFSLNFKDDAVRIAGQRLEEAKAAGADAIISDSPHDLSLLKKAKRKFSSKVKVYDLLTLVAESVKWTSSE